MERAIHSIHEQWNRVRWKTEEAPDVWEPIPVERDAADSKERNRSRSTRPQMLFARTTDMRRPIPKNVAFVLDRLGAVQKRLKEDVQIAWLYLKEFALDPLMTVAKRFGKAATGLAASEARDAIIKWLRQCASEIVRGLLS